MKPYWEQMMTPRPGMPIQEVKLERDNVYIKDQQGRIWQIVIELETPIIHSLGIEHD